MHHATFTESFRRIRAHVAAAELPVTEQITHAEVPGLDRLPALAPDARLSPGLRIAGAGGAGEAADGGGPGGRPPDQYRPPEGDSVRVLLTNDDGVRSAGIQAIRAALARCARRWSPSRPTGNAAGSRKCTFHGRSGCGGGGRPDGVRVNGTLTDCLRAGLLGGLAADAELVVSGINDGANYGRRRGVLRYRRRRAGGRGAGHVRAVPVPATPAGRLSVNYTEHPGPGGPGYDFGLAARHGTHWPRRSAGPGRARRPCSASTTRPRRGPAGHRTARPWC